MGNSHVCEVAIWVNIPDNITAQQIKKDLNKLDWVLEVDTINIRNRNKE